MDEHDRKQMEYVMHGLRDKFYIPFSKKTVDDLLEKTGTDKNTAKFYGKFSNDPDNIRISMRTSEYTYEQFVNSDWKTFEDLAK